MKQKNCKRWRTRTTHTVYSVDWWPSMDSVKNGDGSQLLTNIQGGRNTSVISSTNKVQQTHMFPTWFSQEKSRMSSQYSSVTLSWRKHWIPRDTAKHLDEMQFQLTCGRVEAKAKKRATLAVQRMLDESLYSTKFQRCGHCNHLQEGGPTKWMR